MGKQKGMKMKDLMTATGHPKSTILYYVAEGLLPKPNRAGRNIAEYDPACVDRIRLIRRLQSRKRFSISEIRSFMDKAKDPQELEALLMLEDTVFGDGAGGPRFSREEFLGASGLDEQGLTRLLTASLIIPQDDQGFDREDLAMAKVFARAGSWGLDIGDFLYYPKLAEELADNDIALRERLTVSLEMKEDAVMTAEMTRNARFARTYIFERIFRRRVASMTFLRE
jgi:DNA-binding transcriptional MerR regulator